MKERLSIHVRFFEDLGHAFRLAIPSSTTCPADLLALEQSQTADSMVVAG